MMSPHLLLQSQIKKSTRADGTLDVQGLLALVGEAYRDFDRDKARTDRSIGLMVEELEELNRDLERRVVTRTAELNAARIALDATLQNTTQGFLIIDEDQQVAAFNQLAADLLDLPVSFLERKPKFDEVIQYQLLQSEFANAPDALLQQGIGSGCIRNSPPLYERMRPDGRILEIRTVLLASGGAVRTYSDVTEARQHAAALQQAEKLHRSLFQNSAAGLYRATMDGKVVITNEAFAHMHGYASATEAIEGFSQPGGWRYVVDGKRDEFSRKLLAEGRVVDYVAEVMLESSGKRMWTAETAWLIRDAAGVPEYYEGSIIDISERKATEERIMHLAMHDTLTGLPNRAYLMNWLQTCASQNGAVQDIAIHCIDLDRFKEVNDSLGHAAGDLLLKFSAQRMTQTLRKGDFAVRLGGDEFAIVQLGAKSPSAMSRLANRIIRTISEDFSLDGRYASISASIGIAAGDLNQISGEQILKNADVALYRAKAIGAGSNCIYGRELDAEHHRRRKIETDLKIAVKTGQFLLEYQPILSLKQNHVTSYEALIRWKHPVEGMISPADFIPVAEECELINSIGEWVLRQACETFARSSSDVSLSVNLSPAQLRQRGFVSTVVNVLASTGLAPWRLTLEITETVLLSDSAATRSALRELRALGVKIALDDFGAGHSSLAYLKKYDFDKIKIDRSYIAGKSRSRLNVAVINAVIGLGRDLGIEVIAEGIETQEQLHDLIAAGCDSIQGYFIGRPSPVGSWAELAPCQPVTASEQHDLDERVAACA